MSWNYCPELRNCCNGLKQYVIYAGQICLSPINIAKSSKCSEFKQSVMTDVLHNGEQKSKIKSLKLLLFILKINHEQHFFHSIPVKHCGTCIHFFEGYFFTICSGTEAQGRNEVTSSRSTRSSREQVKNFTCYIEQKNREEKKIKKKSDRIVTLEHSVAYKFETIVLFLLPTLAFFFFPWFKRDGIVPI